MSETGSGGSIPSRIGLRPLLLATLGLLFLTVVMGVSTRATASGLACNANWPLCDGGLLNLFPESMPSFFEWFHRLVAGIAGVFVVGSAVLAWRREASRLVRWTTALGAVLLPIQVLLGRQTVVSFVPPVLAAHYWTAMGIYGSFVVATVVAWRESLGRRHALAGLTIALVSVPLFVVLGPPIVTSYTAPIMATQYVFVLLGFAGLLGATVLTRNSVTSPERHLVPLATGLFPLVVFFGRQRIGPSDLAFGVAHETAATLLVLTLVAAIGLDLRADRGRTRAAKD